MWSWPVQLKVTSTPSFPWASQNRPCCLTSSPRLLFPTSRLSSTALAASASEQAAAAAADTAWQPVLSSRSTVLPASAWKSSRASASSQRRPLMRHRLLSVGSLLATRWTRSAMPRGAPQAHMAILSCKRSCMQGNINFQVLQVGTAARSRFFQAV